MTSWQSPLFNMPLFGASWLRVDKENRNTSSKQASLKEMAICLCPD